MYLAGNFFVVPGEGPGPGAVIVGPGIIDVLHVVGGAVQPHSALAKLVPLAAGPAIISLDREQFFYLNM